MQEVKNTNSMELKEEMKLDWMYKAATVEREDYLLGRSVDKAFNQLETSTGGKVQVDQEPGPSSIFINPSVVTQVDIARKVHEDPLFTIKKKEMETREQLLKNPHKLKQLQEMIKQQKLAAGKKKKKKSIDMTDLDTLLALKLRKLKGKIDIQKLIELSDSDSDSDSENDSDSDSDSGSDSDNDSDGNYRKHTRKKCNKKRQKKDSSDSESSVDSNYKHKKNNKRDKKRSDSVNKKKELSKEKSYQSSDIDSDSTNNRNVKVYHKYKKSKYKEETNLKKSNLSSYSHEKSDCRQKYNKAVSRERRKNLPEEMGKNEHFKRKRSSSFSKINDRNKFSSTDSDNMKEQGKYRENYDKGKIRKSKISSNRTYSSSESEAENKYNSKKHKRKKEAQVQSKNYKKGIHQSDSDEDICSKKRNIGKRRSSSSEDCGNRENSKNKMGSTSEDKSSSISSSESLSEDNDKRKKKAYGLVLPSGYVAKQQPYQKHVQPKVEETKPWKKPKNEKLSEKEMEKRIAEMTQNAQWRDKEREKKIAEYKANQAKEKKEESKYSTEFLRKQMLYAASQGTIEQRIKSNINNIQRNKSDMDKNFARR